MAGRPKPEATTLAPAIRSGDRAALSVGLTLLESRLPAHRAEAERLVQLLLPYTGQSFRLGVSGTPGVGKSTFLEAFGLLLLERGHRVGVLAIDPSSAAHGGSILGDKTRMERLANHPSAFIRPSPTEGTLGGVARATRQSRLLLEAAGYDWIAIETVGVGQSETLVRSMVDGFLLLLQPGGGDDLQGIKRGIVEVADVLVVTKNDGALQATAQHALADYRNALALHPPRLPGWQVPTLALSAQTGLGLPELYQHLTQYQAFLTESGERQRQRQAQQLAWFEELLGEALHERLALLAQPYLVQLREAIGRNELNPPQAVRQVLDRYLQLGT